MAVSAALVLTTFLAPPASADPTGCSSAVETYNQHLGRGWGQSECNAGVQRIELLCYSPISFRYYYISGPWVGANQLSRAYCYEPDRAVGSSVTKN